MYNFFIAAFYRLEILSEKLFDSHKMMLLNSLVSAVSRAKLTYVLVTSTKNARFCFELPT